MKTCLIDEETIDGLAFILAAYLERTLEEGVEVPEAVAREAVVAGLGPPSPVGHAAEEGAPHEWSDARAVAPLMARLEPRPVEAGVLACARALGRVIEDRSFPSTEICAAILDPPGSTVPLGMWVEDMVVCCNHAGFSRLCASVIEAAGMDPETFAERNLEWLAANRRGTSRQRKAEAAASDRAMARLSDLASRPLHPAWPPLVMAALCEVCVGDIRGAVDRIRSNDLDEDDVDVMVMGGSFAGRDDPAVAETLPEELLRTLHALPNRTLTRVADAVFERIGGCMRAAGMLMGPGDVPDMPTHCVTLRGEPSCLDLDWLPWTYLGEPDRCGWVNAAGTAGEVPVEGIFRKVVSAPGRAAADLDTLAARAGRLDDRGLYPGLDDAVMLHLVAVGPDPHACEPVMGLRTAFEVVGPPDSPEIRVTLTDCVIDPSLPPRRASLALACALAVSARHDVRARKRIGPPDAKVTVGYDATGIEDVLPGIGTMLAGLADAASGRRTAEEVQADLDAADAMVPRR